jgi:hypothetical protein
LDQVFTATLNDVIAVPVELVDDARQPDDLRPVPTMS